jgi:DNA-binding MarR family transcriptional regulator
MPSAPSRTQPQEPHHAIAMLNQALRQRKSDLFRTVGVTVQQFAVLRILAETAEAGLPTLELAARLPEKTPGITRLIDRLERKGLVERFRQEDRRRVFCRVTPAGADLAGRVDQEVRVSDAAAFACLNPNEIKVLMHLIRRVTTSLDSQLNSR